jgi:hypothetical protein
MDFLNSGPDVDTQTCQTPSQSRNELTGIRGRDSSVSKSENENVTCTKKRKSTWKMQELNEKQETQEKTMNSM